MRFTKRVIRGRTRVANRHQKAEMLTSGGLKGRSVLNHRRRHGRAALVRWARHAGSLSEEEARCLRGEADRRPSEARVSFEGAVALRETVYRVFSAVARGEEPERSELEALTVAHREALAHPHVVPARGASGGLRTRATILRESSGRWRSLQRGR